MGDKMNNISKLEFISELSDISAQSNYKNGICLFLGDGADVSSGGKLFSELKKESVSFIRNQRIHSFESSERIDEEFDTLIQSVDEQTRCNIVQYIINNSNEWLPSDGYKLLVLLAKENCISSVITTNFANLLETTQELMRMDAFQIFTPATAIPAQYFMESKHKKAIYLKMHGDIDGKLITHLTSSEIQIKSYQDEFVKLFEYLITNETIVFLGYSGWDTEIAKLFEDNITKIKNIYWCNIKKPDENAPLIKIFRKHNISIKYINYNFDKTLQVVAAEFFKDRTLFHVDSIFIWALVKSKVQKIQLDFLNNIKLETKGLKPILRTKISIFDNFIIDNTRNFCIITGNSGVGKSFLMAQLCEQFNSNEQIWTVPLNAMTTYSNNLLDYIVKKLGYASKDPYTVLYQFSQWACEQNKIFIFIIDNLGNRIGTYKEIASLLNKLIELSYVIRNYSNVKFIVTLRTSIWNNIYNLLDINYLNSIIWNEDKDVNYAVKLDSFDQYEVQRASINLLSITKENHISNDILELIKEPSLYGLIQRNIFVLDNIGELNIYNVFEKTFFQGITKTFLEKLAYSLLCNYVKTYVPSKLSDEAIAYLTNDEKLFNILSIEEKKIEFKNDMILECCLSSFFTTTTYIDVFLQFSNSFEPDYLNNSLPVPLYNGILRYLGICCKDFSKIIELLYILLTDYDAPSKYVTKFVNDVLRYMALYNAKEYLNNICNFDIHYKEFTKLLTYFIHSVGFMKDDYAYPLLIFLRNSSSESYKLECNALINDRFTLGIRKSSSAKEGMDYFTKYKNNILFENNPIMSLFSLLWVMGRIGRDNIFDDIYQVIATLVLNEIAALKFELNEDSVKCIKNVFLKNAYFIFFNADETLEEQYSNYPSKSKMVPILNRVQNKEDLSPKDISTICSLINHFGEPIEFFVCNIIFIYMAVYDFDYALKNLDLLYNSFSGNTSVYELDFYSSALFLSCYIVNPINRDIYLKRYNKMLADFEMKVFISPSLERLSSCRKFEDKFDIEFEDGFNILTDYTYTAPMCNYIVKSNNQSIESYLGVFWHLLDILNQNGMYDEILHIIKAINQMSVNWPAEALEALNKFNQCNHPIIRKAIIRTLMENYLRYPNLVTQYLNRSGEAYSDDELLQIYSATQSQIENRTLEQLQWARIIYYIKEYLNPKILEDLLKIFNSAITLNEVIILLIQNLIQ